MIQVKDQQGNVVPGLFKDNLGNIVVQDDLDYRRYSKEKKQAETINTLVKEVAELRQLVDHLLHIVNKR